MFDTTVNEARILVVDDEEMNLALLRSTLRRAGFVNVQTVQDSREVLDRCRTFDPDLILLDLHMPHVDGYAILEALAARTPEDTYLPVLVLTADTTEEATTRALALGAKDFVTKPFHLNEMLLRTRNLLETRMLQLKVKRQSDQLAHRIDEVEGPAERVGAAERAMWSRRVQDLLDGDGLMMVYQPIVGLHSGRIVGVEALARFVVPPVRPPAEWFAEAAEVGLGLQLELHAVACALADLPALPEHVFLAFNVSPEVARSPALAALLRDAPLARLVMEITEHVDIADCRALVEAMAPLRRRGLRVALDDAGTGHASLHRLLQLTPDIIKFDQIMVEGLEHDANRQALIESMSRFAHEVGCEIVAEGIEREEQLDMLTYFGIAMGQGFHLARPAPLPLPPEPLPFLRHDGALVDDGTGDDPAADAVLDGPAPGGVADASSTPRCADSSAHDLAHLPAGVPVAVSAPASPPVPEHEPRLARLPFARRILPAPRPADGGADAGPPEGGPGGGGAAPGPLSDRAPEG